MTRILHIEASPRGLRSHSSGLAKRYLASLGEQDAAVAFDRLDLWREPLPHLEGPLIAAKYQRLQGLPLAAQEASAWRAIEEMVRRLDAADRVVLSTPLWNFSIPYRLKHWIDLVTQPGLSFAFDPERGYSPRLRDRPVDILLASAGDYRDGPSRGRPDLASPYLLEAFAFIGLKSVKLVRVGPTVGPAREVAAGLDGAAAELGLPASVGHS